MLLSSSCDISGGTVITTSDQFFAARNRYSYGQYSYGQFFAARKPHVRPELHRRIARLAEPCCAHAAAHPPTELHALPPRPTDPVTPRLTACPALTCNSVTRHSSAVPPAAVIAVLDRTSGGSVVMTSDQFFATNILVMTYYL